MIREISLKGKIIYGVMVCLMVILMWIGDEGRQPIVYTGSELQRTVGYVDSEKALLIQEVVANAGVIAKTPQYVMNKGSYTIRMQYIAEGEDSVVELWEQANKIAAWQVDPKMREFSADFTLSKDAKQLQVRVNYGGKGNLTIQSLEIVPHTLFYTDTYFCILVFLVLNGLGCLYLRRQKHCITQDKFLDYSIIMGVVLLATSPMMQTYLYNGDDLCYHLARLEGLKDGILDGQIPVNILPDGLRGNGYLNAMYPYLFLYIGAFSRICRVSLALSYKVIVFLANLGSAVCAYVAMKSMIKSRRSVILAVVLYTLMPYRFTNIFSRGDLGETLALVFWPLVIAGLYHVIMGDRKKWYYLVIGFSGALQSHILSAAFVAAVCVITALMYCGRILREHRYREIGKAAGLSLLLNAWYLVPFLYYYFGETIAKDVLRWSGYFEQSINPSNLTQTLSLYNKQYFSLGLALFGCIGIGIVYLLYERRGRLTEQEGFLMYLLLLGAVLTFMITGYFPNRVLMENDVFENIATMLQFPWRFLGPASTCFVFVGAIGLSRSEILKPYRNYVFVLLVGLSLLVIVSVPADNNHMPYDNAQAVASKGHESKLITNIGMFYPHEWRLDGASDDKLITSVVVSDMNNVTVRDYQKKGTKAAVAYTATAPNCYVELPILSYHGYRATDENGNALQIERGNGARMRFMTQGDGVEHRIYVRYGPVIGFVIANLVSALTIAGCIWYLVRRGKDRSVEEPEFVAES